MMFVQAGPFLPNVDSFLLRTLSTLQNKKNKKLHRLSTEYQGKLRGGPALRSNRLGYPTLACLKVKIVLFCGNGITLRYG